MPHYVPLIEFSWTLVMVFITFLVLYLILRKYFFGKVRAFMLAREQKVKDSFDNADAANRMAEERLTDYNQKLAAIEEERREILRAARRQADENAKEIIAKAEEKSSQMILRTEEELRREREKAAYDMRAQIALIAIMAAEKIIEQQLDAEQQHVIIDGVIKQASKAQWKI